MNDDELRALIRSAIQKHTSAQPQPQPQPISISFGQYQIERPAGETECLIEPAVQCNHCGFCKCHGH